MLCTFFSISTFAITWMQVEACPVCFRVPKKTAADFFIESEIVLLARQHPDDPFLFAPIESLKGHSGEGDIDLFVDSVTRRMLKANPNSAVILVRKNSRQPWHSLGIADRQYQEVVKRILAFSGQWGRDGGLIDRQKFFLSLLGSKNRTIFELAYLELGRAPYRSIKEMAEIVSPTDLHPILNRPEYFEWRPLAILLLAQNPNDADRKFIERSFSNCHKFSLTTNLSAWTTAYVELKGAGGLAEIEEIYFRDSTRSVVEIRAILVALSVHGRSGPTRLRDRIVKTYGVALQNHPRVAGPIARDLVAWKKRAYRDRIVKIVENSNFEFDSMDRVAISTYLK